MVRLLRWARGGGFGEPGWPDEPWGQYVLQIIRRERSPDAFAPVDAALAAFFANRTKAEVIEAACKRELLLAPLLSLGEFVDSEQLAARGFATEVPLAEAGRALRFPGPFARFERTPIRYAVPAPRLDAHGAALRAEPARAPAPTGREPTGAPPLAGV